MKKVIISIWLCLFTSLLFAQISPVYDTEKDELYGYVVLEFIEKVDRKNSRYIVSLLDINLNGVIQNKFIGEKNMKLGNTNFNGKHIYFEMISEKDKGYNPEARYFSYHIYNLEKNTISDNHKLPDQSRKIYVRGSYPIKNKGFGIITQNERTNVTQIHGISNENQVLYNSYPYGKKKKRDVENLSISAINENVATVIAEKLSRGRGRASKRSTSLLLINLRTGEKMNEVNFDTDKFKMRLKNAQFIDDKIIALGDTFEKKRNVKSGKTAGLFKAELNLDGEILQQEERTWLDLQSELDIKENGLVRKKGFIATQKHVFNPANNHTIIVGEYIRGVFTSIEVRDIILLDFDENFNLTQVFEEDKTINTFSTSILRLAGSRKFKNNLNYDYNFHNTLENKSGLSFFFSDFDIGLFSGSLSHNIITYKNGDFASTNLDGKLKGWWKQEKLMLSTSKPGFFLVSKVVNNKITDFRLERVDY